MKQNYHLSRTLAAFLLLFLCVQESFSQFKVVGYMPSWAGSASAIQYTKLTHINYSFLLPNASGGYAPIENPAKLQDIVARAHAAGVKVYIAVGGWNNGNDSPFETFAASAGGRTTFVNNMVNFVNQYNLDGVDIDWEYPDPGASANNFAALMQQLGDAMHSRGKGLSAAVVASGSTGGGVLNSVFNVVDFLNLMAYDGNDFQHSTYNYAVESLNYWKGRGLPASKAILGVPFYGRPSWESFAALVARGANPNADVFGNVGYNGIATIKSKTQLAKDQAGGIMMWELSQDATGANSLLTAINQVVGTNTNTPPSVSISSPGNGASFTAGSSVAISANASDNGGSVTKVEFFVDGAKISEDATSPYTATYANAVAGTHSLTARATDNGGLTTTSSAISINVTGVVTQSPYGGAVRNIPGKIEAEHYDLGGQGVAYNDVTTANQGNAFRTDAVDIEACSDAGTGFNVGYVVAGEWLEYMVNVTATGTYKMDFRVAAITAGKTFHVEFNGVNVTGAITVPNTTGWQIWSTVSASNISLTAGQKVMRIVMDAGDFNLNYVNISSGGDTNTPPAVSITSPGNGATFTAGNSVSITASASDASPGSVTKVEFFVDGAKISEDAIAPYTASYSSVAGTHSLTARATDNGGLSTTSAAISITVNGVNNNTPPSVSISSPGNGATFTAGNSVSITAAASDASPGSVTKVEFFVDGAKISEDAIAPYTATYSNAVAGTHSLTARATDNGGLSTTSAAVSITVNGTTGGCTGVAQYVENGGYAAGSKVQNVGGLYQCKPWPYSGWCNGAAWAYGPGTGAYWSDAWEKIGTCSGSRAATTAASAKAIEVYPNPTNNTSLVKLTIADASDADVIVSNQLGVIVYKGTLSNSNMEGTIDLTGMEAGIYVIKISANGNVWYEKLLKQ